LLVEGDLNVTLEEITGQIRKTIIGQLFVSAGEGVKEGKEYENVRLLALNSLFNKQAYPRSTDLFQLFAAEHFHHNMKAVAALDPLSKLGLCASKAIITTAEEQACLQAQSYTSQGLTSIDVFDNCEYAQGRKHYGPDSKPVFYKTINMAQIKHHLPGPTEQVWKARAPDEDIQTWMLNMLECPEEEMEVMAEGMWEVMYERFQRGHRVSRPESAHNYTTEWHVLPPLLEGDGKVPGVAGDTGYSKNLGAPEEMRRVLEVLRVNGIQAGVCETRIGYGDEQAFETGVKVRFIINPEYVTHHLSHFSPHFAACRRLSPLVAVAWAATTQKTRRRAATGELF
jgi:hypothetical protein